MVRASASPIFNLHFAIFNLQYVPSKSAFLRPMKLLKIDALRANPFIPFSFLSSVGSAVIHRLSLEPRAGVVAAMHHWPGP
jgi:hypothetical protein